MGVFDIVKGIFGKASAPVRAINYPMSNGKWPDQGSTFVLNEALVKEYINSAIRAYVTVPEFAAAVETLKADIIAEGWSIQGDDDNRVNYITETLQRQDFNHIFDTFLTDALTAMNAYLEFHPLPIEVFDEFVKMEKGRRPSKAFSLWNVSPTSMSIITDEHGKPKEYVQNYGMGGDAEVHFAPNEILHFALNKPANLPYGVPYAAAVDQDLALLTYAKNYAKKFFKNSAIPDLVALYVGGGTLTDRQKKELAALFERLKGIDDSHKTLILQGKFQFEKLNDFNKDIEFLQLMNRARENIWSVYGTPADRILGVRDRDLNSYYSKVNYIQKLIESFFNSKIFSQFGVRFVLNRTYQVDELRVTQRYVLLVQNGILTPDEARAELGYKPGLGQDVHPNENGNAQLPERDIASARQRGGDGISDAPQDRGANLDNIPNKSADFGPFIEVEFDTLKSLVEKKYEFWQAPIMYYEGSDYYVLYWKDGEANYKSVVKKEELEDEEIFRFEYLRNATKVLTEL